MVVQINVFNPPIAIMG